VSNAAYPFGYFAVPVGLGVVFQQESEGVRVLLGDFQKAVIIAGISSKPCYV
jgi:hypothetical protein